MTFPYNFHVAHMYFVIGFCAIDSVFKVQPVQLKGVFTEFSDQLSGMMNIKKKIYCIVMVGYIFHEILQLLSIENQVIVVQNLRSGKLYIFVMTMVKM